MKKIDAGEIVAVQFNEQATDPATPVAGKRKLFFKAGGLYAIDGAGAVVGPLGAGGASALDGLSDVDAGAPSAGDVLTWDAVAGAWKAAAPTGGGGDVLSYAGYTSITTQAQLAAMTTSGKYILANDIALTGNWTPIPGTFVGRLVSNGKVISGFGHTAAAGGWGLFTELGNGAILAGFDMGVAIVASESASYKGVLCGQQGGVAYFLNVGLFGTVNCGGDRFGGFIGYQAGAATKAFYLDCRSLLTMTNTAGGRVGGFVGYAEGDNRTFGCLSVHTSPVGAGAAFAAAYNYGHVLPALASNAEFAWIYRSAM